MPSSGKRNQPVDGDVTVKSVDHTQTRKQKKEPKQKEVIRKQNKKGSSPQKKSMNSREKKTKTGNVNVNVNVLDSLSTRMRGGSENNKDDWRVRGGGNDEDDKDDEWRVRGGGTSENDKDDWRVRGGGTGENDKDDWRVRGGGNDEDDKDENGDWRVRGGKGRGRGRGRGRGKGQATERKTSNGPCRIEGGNQTKGGSVGSAIADGGSKLIVPFGLMLSQRVASHFKDEGKTPLSPKKSTTGGSSTRRSSQKNSSDSSGSRGSRGSSRSQELSNNFRKLTQSLAEVMVGGGKTRQKLEQGDI